MITLAKKYYYPVMSGLCACCSSLFGKLSGNYSGELCLDNVVQLSFKAAFIGLMLTSGAAVWTFYVKALQESKNTIVPTLISTASNYVLTAVAGFLFFNEPMTILWWSGMLLIMSGIILVTLSSQSQSPGDTDPSKEIGLEIKCNVDKKKS